MIVAIVGSRTYPLRTLVIAKVNALALKYPDCTVISGGARGVDTWAMEAAVDARLTTTTYPANWDEHGKRAGFLRNENMAQKADVVIAFWDGSSRGTAHMIKVSRELGKRVFVYGVHGELMP